MIFQPSKSQLPTPEQALPGRADAILRSAVHHVNHTNIMRPFADKYDQILLGLGCFWGAEKLFWQMPGVFVTAVGYAAGYTKNPTYQEVCSGQTAHNEVVLVVYDPELVSLETLLVAFWEGHDPTQGMRQGNDAGTQYRSGIYCLTVEQLLIAEQSKVHFQEKLSEAGRAVITTELMGMPAFYYAEEYHQQYLSKNPGGYCGLGGVGVKF